METLQKIDWMSARQIIKPLNPDFVSIVDRLSLDEKYYLWKATHHFGDQILKQGDFYLPGQQGELMSSLSDKVSQLARDDLTYSGNTIPVMILIKNTLELFVPISDRVIPYLIMKPGDLFGVWKVLDTLHENHRSHAPYDIWDMTAGARSVFMAPKVSETIGHMRLQKKYHFNYDKPRAYRDHWKIFKSIYNSERFPDEWTVEVLYFPKFWFEKLNDPAWSEFKMHLLDFNWKCSEYWRNQFSWKLTFSRINNLLGLNYQQHQIDTAMHLFATAVGALPGFTPVLDDALGPFTKIQEIYVNDYGLKWLPIMMQPCTYRRDKPNEAIYYSLTYPTALELTMRNSKRASVINDIYQLSCLVNIYAKQLLQSDYGLSNTHLTYMCQQTDFRYYHCEPSDYGKITDSRELTMNDARFESISSKFSGFEFPFGASFFNGCISVQSRA